MRFQCPDPPWSASWWRVESWGIRCPHQGQLRPWALGRNCRSQKAPRRSLTEYLGISAKATDMENESQRVSLSFTHLVSQFFFTFWDAPSRSISNLASPEGSEPSFCTWTCAICACVDVQGKMLAPRHIPTHNDNASTTLAPGEHNGSVVAKAIRSSHQKSTSNRCRP